LDCSGKEGPGRPWPDKHQALHAASKAQAAGGDTRTSGARRRRLPLRLTLAGGKPKQRHAGWHARG
jgi:hypothetical protein